MTRSRCLATALLAAATLAMAACADTPTNPDERAEFEAQNDPLEPMNREIFDFNMTLDRYVMKPVARFYIDTVPDDARQGLHNMLNNLGAPYTFANDLLEARFHPAADTLGRFMVNSTFGVAGFFDVAAENGGPQYHSSDFAQTLGVWGIPSGPYLMLPVFGPSSPRDAVGTGVEWVAEPTGRVIEIYSTAGSDARTGLNMLDSRAQVLDAMDEVQRNAIDFYASIRSLYRQQREAGITGKALTYQPDDDSAQ
jgi:phospholipid-binding lipoprotein MlaA